MKALKSWILDVIHNCIIHPIMPFLPAGLATDLHDRNANWAFGSNRWDEIGIEREMAWVRDISAQPPFESCPTGPSEFLQAGLTGREREELRTLILEEARASAALPFLEGLADQGRLKDIPNAVWYVSHLLAAPVPNLSVRFLAFRIPAVIVRSYWGKKPPEEFRRIVRKTLHDGSWTTRIVDAVTSRDGLELERTIAEFDTPQR